MDQLQFDPGSIPEASTSDTSAATEGTAGAATEGGNRRRGNDRRNGGRSRRNDGCGRRRHRRLWDGRRCRRGRCEGGVRRSGAGLRRVNVGRRCGVGPWRRRSSSRGPTRGDDSPTRPNKEDRDDDSSGPPVPVEALRKWAKRGTEGRMTPVSLGTKRRRVGGIFNHVLKTIPSTHGCQHIVEEERREEVSLPDANRRCIDCRRPGGERSGRVHRRSL